VPAELDCTASVVEVVETELFVEEEPVEVPPLPPEETAALSRFPLAHAGVHVPRPVGDPQYMYGPEEELILDARAHWGPAHFVEMKLCRLLSRMSVPGAFRAPGRHVPEGVSRWTRPVAD
jgi:hypothetical protein